jgi:acyl-coenzyme A thioesterase PaaI-like protein
VGRKLNGHGGIVHGGILSLLFDEAMGWAYECLRHEGGEEDDRIDRTSLATAVTANLTVDYRAPFPEGSDAVIRVRHYDSEGRKIYFAATLESKDGGVTYAEARSLFVIVSLDRLKKV